MLPNNTKLMRSFNLLQKYGGSLWTRTGIQKLARAEVSIRIYNSYSWVSCFSLGLSSILVSTDTRQLQ